MSYVDPEELLGSLDGLVNFITANTQPLTAKGLNPAMIKGNLEGVKSDLSAKKNDRDAKKAALKEAQQAFETSASTNYRTFSDAVDTVSGALGKQTPQGQQVLNYRKNVTGSNRKPGDTTAPAAKTTPA